MQKEANGENDGIDIKILSMDILMVNIIYNKINAYVTHGPCQPTRQKE